MWIRYPQFIYTYLEHFAEVVVGCEAPGRSAVGVPVVSTDRSPIGSETVFCENLAAVATQHEIITRRNARDLRSLPRETKTADSAAENWLTTLAKVMVVFCVR